METTKNSNGMNPENLGTPTINTKPQKKKWWKGLIKEVFIFAVIAFGIVLPFRLYIAEPYVVDGRSMDPTFATGDYLIVDKLSYKIGAPKRNSVIVFKYPVDTRKSFVKRIIGLPGETVIMEKEVVRIVNAENPEGFVLDQSYVTHPAPGYFSKKLADDEYFVMGDNRKESFDSRYWGPLQKKYLLGKPILQLLPLSKISILPGDDRK